MINATPVRPLASTPTSGLPTATPPSPVSTGAVPPMPPSSSASSTSFTPQPKKRFSLKMILGLMVFLVVAVGAVAGFYLSQQQQDNRQQAAEPVESCASVGGGSCVPSCFTGTTPAGKLDCPGALTCCRAVAGPACPSGSTRVSENQCRCNDSGITIPNNGTCPKPANCPAGTTSETGQHIGKCRCADGTLILPNQTCPSAPPQTCLDVPGNTCSSSCGSEFDFEGTRSCGGSLVCCKPKNCPTGSTRNSSNGLCECNATGASTIPGGTCAPPTSCGSYKKKGKCEQAGDSFNCGWDNGACKAIADHCPAGATAISTGADVGKCKCTVSGAVVGPNGSCNVTCAQSGGTCTIGTSCGAGSTTAPDTASQCGTAICCKPLATGALCQNQGGTCTIGSSCGNGQTVVPGTGGTCGQGICCKPLPIGEYCRNQGGTCTIGSVCGTGTSAVPGTGGTCGQGICCKPTGVGGTNPNPPTGALCPNPPNLPAVKYLRFTCDNGCTQDSSDGKWHCYEKREEFTSDPGGLKNPNDCGQVDVLSGASDATYCGWTVNTCEQARCQPQTNPSPSPSTVAGPMCVNISMRVNGSTEPSTTAPNIGDSIQFRCGNVQGINHYRFRVVLPDGTKVNLTTDNKARNSEAYIVPNAGTFYAQCAICTGPNSESCQAYEKIPDLLQPS